MTMDISPQSSLPRYGCNCLTSINDRRAYQMRLTRAFMKMDEI
jgi:hypothetical protein